MRFKRKPQEVEAIQWNGWYTSDLEVKPYIHRDSRWTCPKCGGIDLAHGWVDTFEDGYIVCPGDYIVKDTSTASEEILSYSPDQFQKIFDPVDSMETDTSS